MTTDDYIQFLKDENFNDAQIEFLLIRKEEYERISQNEDFWYDGYERDMWYTMNRSGLFEKDEDNKTEIYHWCPDETRYYITEL